MENGDEMRCERVGNDRVDSERYERENEMGNEWDWDEMGEGWKIVDG